MGQQSEKFTDMNKIFARHQEIKAVYLFGSHARGEATDLSDLDLAVLLEEGAAGDERAQKIKLDLLTALTQAGYDDIDLVILNNLSIVGKYEVVKHNCLIYQVEDFEASTYYSLQVRKYLDFKPYLEVQRKALKERILNG